MRMSLVLLIVVSMTVGGSRGVCGAGAIPLCYRRRPLSRCTPHALFFLLPPLTHFFFGCRPSRTLPLLSPLTHAAVAVAPHPDPLPMQVHGERGKSGKLSPRVWGVRVWGYLISRGVVLELLLLRNRGFVRRPATHQLAGALNAAICFATVGLRWSGGCSLPLRKTRIRACCRQW